MLFCRKNRFFWHVRIVTIKRSQESSLPSSTPEGSTDNPWESNVTGQQPLRKTTSRTALDRMKSTYGKTHGSNSVPRCTPARRFGTKDLLNTPRPTWQPKSLSHVSTSDNLAARAPRGLVAHGFNASAGGAPREAPSPSRPPSPPTEPR